jgi:hypothetical protein
VSAAPEEEYVSSGQRLLQVLDALEMSGYEFAAYWAGFPLGAPVMQDEDSDRGRRFRAAKRAIHRWVRDEFVMAEHSAYEVVEVANRVLKARRKRQLPADFLVTPEEEREAGMEEVRRLLGEIVARLDALEGKLA